MSGETYSWVPTSWEGANGIVSSLRTKGTVHGKIVYINENHRYFTAEANVGGVVIRERFNFKEGADMLSYKTKDGKVTELTGNGGTLRNDR